jgi:HrpA-like RNA helicase
VEREGGRRKEEGWKSGGGNEGGGATGDFLIFMPGQDEVESTCFWLEMQVCHVARSSKVVK